MFNDIFPEKLNRFVFHNPKQPKDHTRDAASSRWPDYKDPSRSVDREEFADKGSAKKPKKDPKVKAWEMIEGKMRWLDYKDPNRSYYREMFAEEESVGKAKVSPQEKEAVANLASDFPEFVKLDKKNPRRFTIDAQFRLHWEMKRFVEDLSTYQPATFEIKGDMVHVISHGRKSLIQKDCSLYVLNAALQISKEYVQAKKKGDKKAMAKAGGEFAEWMKHPTDTFQQRSARKKMK